jgi:hypothetical protein
VEDEPLLPVRGASPRARLLRDGRSLGSDFIRLPPSGALRWSVTAGEGLSVSRLDLPAAWQAWVLSGSGDGGVRQRIFPGVDLPAGTGDTLLLIAGLPSALSALPEWDLAREAPSAAEAAVRRSPRGPELFLALPGNAEVTWSAGSADGRRTGATRVRLGPGWHRLPLADGNRSRGGGAVGAAGAYWVQVEVAGQGWRLRRTLPFSRL